MKPAGLAAVLLLLAGCGDATTEYKTSEYVFGTLVEVTVRGVAEEKARAAVAAVSEGFRRMHKDWHAWKPGGELMTLNAACKTGAAVTLSDFTLDQIKAAKTYYAQSDGLFDAAVGEIVGAWGFHADEPPKGRIPPLATIRALAAAHPGMDDIHIDGHTVTCANPAAGLDFGGFAKGAAVDWALAEMKKRGIANAVISAGGNVGAMGSHGDRPWRIGIRDPKKWGVIASVDLEPDESVYTSGNYERFREWEGVRYSHIIDPRTGMPVDHILSTTVIAENGSLADAASTALTVAGMRDWPRIAKRMGITRVLMVDDSGTIAASPDMAKRLIFPEGQKPNLVIRPIE
ncbi:FAD:protein FMN transferase [Oleispirillum naphthae]|uniref:FAD:protein FMN transferase n=1 Tax=Oleispirillum naphthae TaxID=2838853 RepID=UPI0030825F8A